MGTLNTIVKDRIFPTWKFLSDTTLKEEPYILTKCMDIVICSDEDKQIKSLFTSDLKAKILRRLTELRSYTKVNVEKELKGRLSLKDMTHMLTTTSHFCLFFVFLGIHYFAALWVWCCCCNKITHSLLPILCLVFMMPNRPPD
jgi:hypothetical protein